MFYVVGKKHCAEFDVASIAVEEAKETGGVLVWYSENNGWNELDYSR